VQDLKKKRIELPIKLYFMYDTPTPALKKISFFSKPHDAILDEKYKLESKKIIGAANKNIFELNLKLKSK
jgi:hypothetical protein